MQLSRNKPTLIALFGCLLLWPALASAWTTHIATNANTSGNTTVLDLPYANGNPHRILLVTPVYNPNNVYNNHPIGVWYNALSGRWGIFNQDSAAMPLGAAFNVIDASTSSNVYVHTANSTNIAGNYTYLNSPHANGLPGAFIYVTPNWNPGGSGGAYLSRHIGVWYDRYRGQWAIFNQDLSPMPQGVSFNVIIVNSTLVQRATSTNTVGHITYLSGTGDPTTTLFITPNWNPSGTGGTYNNHATGVWYDNHRRQWAIFNQDGAAMPEGAAFNVWALNIPQ